MKTSIRIAALLVAGAVFMGCDDKKDAATTPPATPNTPTVTTPNTPTVTTPTVTTPTTTDMSGKMGQINGAIDKGAASAKSEADKLMSNAPTTAPAIPGMGK